LLRHRRLSLSPRCASEPASAARLPQEVPQPAAAGDGVHSEASNPHYPLALPAGTLLADRYRLLRPIGESSAFAITYLADDQADGATAVLKEFFPRSLVRRDG